MRMQRVEGILVLSAAVMAAGLLGAGCPKEEAYNKRPRRGFSHDEYPHNMNRVKCRNQTDKNDIDIEVNANQSVLGNDDDRAVFVCPGEKVYWYTKQDKVTFEVDFSGPGADTLFDQATTNFKSGAVDPSNHHGIRQMTPVGVLAATTFYAHKYLIVAKDKDGKVWKLDPHVIPMGK